MKEKNDKLNFIKIKKFLILNSLKNNFERMCKWHSTD